MFNEQFRICLLTGWVACAGLAQAELHEFNLPDGRSVRGKIIDYNARLGKMELQREDGKRIKVSPSVFVETDQKYIQEWAMLENFRRRSNFNVECSKRIIEKWKKDGAVHQVRSERLEYEVFLENRSAVPFENLKVEYCIFYEQERSTAGRKKTTQQKTRTGILEIDRLEPKEKRTLKTESVVLHLYEFNATDYYYDRGDPETARGEIKGIWLRVSSGTPGGLKAIRNFYEPASIEDKYDWPGVTASSARNYNRKKD